jgi:hypothetical protein
MPTGVLHINATPWAEVWIDNTAVGPTPIGNHRVAIGPHEIVFKHPKLGESKASVVVKAGTATRVTADLTK